MFANMGKLIRQAQREHKAVASLNIYSADTIKGALLAAQDENSPVILSFGAKYLKNMTLQQAAFLAETCGKDVSVPYALHLDHCTQIDVIRKAIDAGFPSVMYDGSMLPFEENVENTRRVTRLAHAAGVDVEGELGRLTTGRSAAENTGNTALYTDPELALAFCNETGVDALAVSIGTVHGLYREAPCIRLDVLKAIRARVDVPLVLHGGSDNSAKVLRETIENGICKVNVNTELSMRCLESTRELLQKRPDIHLSDLYLYQIESFRQACREFIRIFQADEGLTG